MSGEGVGRRGELGVAQLGVAWRGVAPYVAWRGQGGAGLGMRRDEVEWG